MKKLYYIIYIGIFMLLLAGCQDEGMFTPESDGDEPVYVTYRVHMGDETLSRAIGDANKVNELKVGVFQDNQLLKIFTFDKAEDADADAFTNVTLPLLKQGTYNLVFWAQKKDNGIYSIDGNFNITIDYAKYQEISLAGTEDFEAFTVVKKDVSVANPGGPTITLTRPFAQLNIAASENDIFNKVNKVSFTIDTVYKKFNPLTGVSSEGVTGQEFSYSFSDQDIAVKQAIIIDRTNYYYLASAYLLAPEKVSLTGGLYEGDELVKGLNVTELPLNANSRTNIYGDMIQQEELEPWDGVIPTECPLTQDAQNRYIIDEEADIAWLTVPENVSGLNAPTFLVSKDVLNMDNKTISSIQLPAGSTFDGNGKTIKCYANSLFGDATNITVKNLTLDNVTATSDSHVGVLVNTLTGSSTFTGISITNSSATTTNGAAGGMIGYITNKKDERLNVTISACTLTDNIVDGSLTSGVYVGRFKGYDNNETLTFSSCNESSATINGTEPYYVEGNEATWLANNDYSNYSGWLGNEEFYRGTVMYGSNRFIPCWDGTTKVTPLTDGTTKLIYSAFDLASLQETAAGDIKLMENVDMDNKTISSIQLPAGSTFDGNGKTIKCYANSLFGDATNITVKNLALDNVTATSDSHVGVLVNTLTGSSFFTGISITNSSATTINGAAGGMIGYITNKKDERLNVTINACTITDNKVDGSLTSGVYVGRFRGYDNNETLTFSSCNYSSATINGTEPYYVEGNEATWLANNDYSNYSGWLGNEEFYRGTVMYGSNRFIPCWDGTTKIAPLTDGTTKLIYSAFDLANLQGTAAGNIKLMENVDMEHDLDGASKDGVRNHIFKALSTLTKLDGNGKTIYNITIRDNYYGGFVKSESCATTFENVTFDGADIRVTHDTDEGNAYVGTLRGMAYASTTINNVHVKNGYLNGVCKIGGLCGGIFSKITCSNSTVSNYSIENYDSQIISAGFKANGEIGGLIGYITVLDANTVNEISNCTVSDNNFNCVTYSASLWDRSVAPFIGDIRTQEAGTVRINNCKILGTNTYTNASDGKTATFDQHRQQTGWSGWKPTYTYYPLVGQCYAVSFLGMGDKKGTVHIDDTQIF